MKTNHYILLAGIIGFIFYCYWDQHKYGEVKSKGLKTIGTIETFGSQIICQFEIKGEVKTKRMTTPNAYITDGEHYWVYYYSKMPDKYYISFTEPVYDSISFGNAFTNKIEVKRTGFILFEFSVLDKKYERLQILPEDMQIREGQKFPIKYKKDNPKIAYIVF